MNKGLIELGCERRWPRTKRDQTVAIVCFKREQREHSASGSVVDTLHRPTHYICASFVQILGTQALPDLAMDSKCISERKRQPPTDNPVANPAPGVAFNVRPFPPNNLVGVPVDFIVTSLNKFAPHYWQKPQTADCTISALPRDLCVLCSSSPFTAIPFGNEPKSRSRSRSDPPAFPSTSATRPRGKYQFHPDDVFIQGPLFSTTTVTLKLKDAAGRRSSASSAEEGTRRRLVVKVCPSSLISGYLIFNALQLHRDYLVCQSSLLHAYFTSTTPVDLLSMKHTSQLAAGAFPIPAAAQPRLLPCAPNHPHLFLPLPDPNSFPHIIHYLYFGKINYIESSLCRGSITWEGLVRNVEYLGLRNPIKVFLGRWWAEWLDPTRECKALNAHPTIEEESEGEDGGDEAEPDIRTLLREKVSRLKNSRSKTLLLA
jgi:hypothetical protein